MARRGGVSEDLLDDVRLAVGEACARAVRLHQRHGLTAAVTLELVDGDTFTVVVADHVADRGLDGEAGGMGGGVAGAAGGPSMVATLAGGPGSPGSSGGSGSTGGSGGSGPGNAAASSPARAPTPGTVTAPAQRDAGGSGVDERWASTERLGLAVLAGVVDDLRVERGDAGTRVRMRWPAGG